MRKIVLILGLISFMSFIPIKTEVNLKHHIEKYDCKYNQCQATAKSTGNQCKHCVSNSEDSYC